MHSRAGRPPKAPTGDFSTITLRLPAEIKQKIIDDSEAVDMSMTEYVCTLAERGFDS
jgi:hypothetical protein